MCTFTAVKSADNVLFLTMNRDEKRMRLEAGLEVQCYSNGEIVFPKDAEAGGTWLGSNSDGVVCALLNRYQDTATPNAANMCSRGAIIPDALRFGGFDAVCQHLQSVDFSVYQPCNVLVFSLQQARCFGWSGQALHVSDVSSEQPYMLTSSSVEAAYTLSYREGLFRQWAQSYKEATLGAESVLAEYHTATKTGAESESVLMSRALTHTKSISQIVMSEYSQELHYTNFERLDSLVCSGCFLPENSHSFCF